MTDEPEIPNLGEFHETEVSEEDYDMTLPASREEVIALIQNVAGEMQNLADQFSEAINKVLANQQYLDDRLKKVEDPARPKIYIP